MRAAKELLSQLLVFAEQAEQDMFRLYRNRPKLAGFVSCEKDYPARLFGITFEHSLLSALFRPLLVITIRSGRAAEAVVPPAARFKPSILRTAGRLQVVALCRKLMPAARCGS